MLWASASTSTAGYWPLVSPARARAPGGGATPFGGSGGGAGVAERTGSGAGAASTSLGWLRSASRCRGGDGLTFGVGAGIRAFVAAVALDTGELLRRGALLARGVLRSGGGASLVSRLAGVATDFAAAARIGFTVTRALGFLGVLAMTSVSCRFEREARSRFGHNRSVPVREANQTFRTERC